MSSTTLRDLGDILFRVATFFLGAVLAGLAFGLGAELRLWGWVLAIFGMPTGLWLRNYGAREVLADDAMERKLAEAEAQWSGPRHTDS